MGHTVILLINSKEKVALLCYRKNDPVFVAVSKVGRFEEACLSARLLVCLRVGNGGACLSS